MAAVLPLLFTERGEEMTFIISSLLLLVSGVYYPISVLPGWMQAAARISPATYVLEGMRATVLDGKPTSELGRYLIPMAIIGALTIPLGMAVFTIGRTLRQADRSAETEWLRTDSTASQKGDESMRAIYLMGTSVYLRAMIESDKECGIAWFNTRLPMGGFGHVFPIDASRAADLLKEENRGLWPSGRHRYAIVRNSNEEVVGALVEESVSSGRGARRDPDGSGARSTPIRCGPRRWNWSSPGCATSASSGWFGCRFRPMKSRRSRRPSRSG